ncbi:MAG: 2 protein [Patescibacteria group bacterium]|nr:2 protein [Patescibacteria group bacterium]
MRFIFQKKAFLAAFLGILALGCFLRTYNFSDWLHFELDQARDADVVFSAAEGSISELPLLGPRARGTFLRLGPAYYYLEYASAKIFGNTPPGMAVGVLLLAIFSLPLMYLFFRRYFDKKISLALFAISNFSIFLIMYSRFAWNPNPLVFFVPLALYSTLRAVDEKESRRGIWLAAALTSLSISTQLHFLAFIALPLVFLIFFIFKRPKISLKFWMLAISIALLFYIPVFLNEYQTGGDNTEEFLKTISGKSEDSSVSLVNKIFFNIKEHSAGYFLILSGRDGNSLLGLNLNGLAARYRDCGENCPQDYYLGFFSAAFVFFGFLILVLNFKKETDPRRKDFLLLNGLWFSAIFLLFIPLAMELSPRYFLISAFLPFVFLGLILETIPRKMKPIWVISAVVFILAVSNGLEVKKRFGELAMAHKINLETDLDLLLKEKTRVTYRQEKMIEKYMLQSQTENGQAIFFSGDARYVPALEFLLKEDEAVFDDKIPRDHIYRQANYFWVDFTRSDGSYSLGKKETPLYDIAGVKNFGTLSVLTLLPKEGEITDETPNLEQPPKKHRSGAPKRYLWEEIFD